MNRKELSVMTVERVEQLFSILPDEFREFVADWQRQCQKGTGIDPALVTMLMNSMKLGAVVLAQYVPIPIGTVVQFDGLLPKMYRANHHRHPSDGEIVAMFLDGSLASECFGPLDAVISRKPDEPLDGTEPLYVIDAGPLYYLARTDAVEPVLDYNRVAAVRKRLQEHAERALEEVGYEDDDESADAEYEPEEDQPSS